MVLRQGGEAPAYAGCLDGGSWVSQASFSDGRSSALLVSLKRSFFESSKGGLFGNVITAG